MAKIRGKSFKPSTPLSSVEIQGLVVPGAGGAADLILREKWLWDGSPGAFFFLSLGSDNVKIGSCRLSVLGKLSQEIIISPHRFFPDIPKETSLKIPNLNLQQFLMGKNLISQPIQVSTLKPIVSYDGELGTWESYVEEGGKDICIRLHLTPTAEDKAKLMISLIPLAAEDLEAMECEPAEVPSFLVLSKEIPLSPKSITPWGLAFTTLIIKGDPAKPVGEVSQPEIRKAVHAVLQGAMVTRFCAKTTSYHKRMEKINKGEVPSAKLAGLWPEPMDSGNTSGNQLFYLFIFFCLICFCCPCRFKEIGAHTFICIHRVV
jgi:hypothetical protein